ncbi:MAG: HlyD family efflux transporter periplasmic adaptor subunit [Gemmatimonadales bacterium]
MTAGRKRLVLWSSIGVVVLIGFVLAFAPEPVTVDVVEAEIGPLMVTVDYEGDTRIHDVFALSAPVAGHLRRIEAHVGDGVVAGETVLAEIEPGDPTFLDPRSEAQARAAVEAARSARALAEAEVESSVAELEFAEAEHRRARELIGEGTITRRDADSAERAFKTARAALATAQAALQIRIYELQQAEAQLLTPADRPSISDGSCPCISLTAPVGGRVLRIPNQSERMVQPGDALLEIGDPSDLEIVTDYLSSDAVRIRSGQRVIIDNWGGEAPLEGKVRYVEPFGFTKISALGIEEQRVNVVIDITSPREDWTALGHGYQVETRVVLLKTDAALVIPLTALFRDGERWAAFVLDDGNATLRHLDVGRRSGLEAEILSGLTAGERVIVHPSDRVRDGVRARVRG